MKYRAGSTGAPHYISVAFSTVCG